MPISSWASSALEGAPDSSTTALAVQPASSVVAPVLSMPGSLEEDRLLAEARQEAAAAALTARQAEAAAAAAKRAEAAEKAKAARKAAAERARRERASRDGARTPRLVIAGAPDDVWARLRRCEAGGDYRRNSGNGYYGAYQFAAGTWRSLGYPGLPHQAPPEVQDEAARKLQQRSGWGQWPACSRRIGVR